MLLLKHLHNEIDIANERIKGTPLTTKSSPKVEDSWRTHPDSVKCLLWEGSNLLQPSALGKAGVPL